MEEETYLVDEETGDQYRLGGFIPSEEESDLPKFSASRKYGSSQLPPGVDLRQFMTPVEHQLTLNSCVGNALAGAYEFLVMKNKGKKVDVSRLFIYYNSRQKDGFQDYNMQDRGTFIRSAIASLSEFGCCKEDLFPYQSAYVNQRPPAHCYSEAKKYRIQQGIQVNNDLNEMKACLAEGYPFAFGIELFTSFGQAKSNGGVVPMPQPHLEQQAQQHGWHAMLAAGYSDQQRCFIVRNSWGEDWGDKGYCYIPYEYMCDKKRCQDLHAIKLITDEPVVDHRRDQVPNPYNWDTHKNIQYFVPSNYHYNYFNNTWFWKTNATQYYYGSNAAAASNKKSSWVIKKTSGREENQPRRKENQSRQPQEPEIFSILWIDENSEENSHLAKKFHMGTKAEIQFFKRFADGLAYLQQHKDSIRSSPSKYLLICRGYYRNENKNPLDLLQNLDRYQLSNVPIIVFTQDKSGLLGHLYQQAASLGIDDWEERLQITNDAGEFASIVKHLIRN